MFILISEFGANSLVGRRISSQTRVMIVIAIGCFLPYFRFRQGRNADDMKLRGPGDKPNAVCSSIITKAFTILLFISR